MRKHIKIKVKTILLLSIIACVLLFSKTIYWQGIKIYNTLAPDNYQIELQSMNTRSLESENNRLSLILKENNYEIFMLATIEDGYTIDGMRIGKEDAVKIHDTYLSYEKRYDLYKDYSDYVLNVALTQWFSGNSDLAIEILNGFDEQITNDDVHMIKAGMALGVHDFEEVLNSLSKVQSKTYDETKNSLYYFLMHFMGVELYDIDLEGFTVIKNTYDLNDLSGRFSYLFGTIYSLNAASQNDPIPMEREAGKRTDQSVTGHVTINDQPVKGAFVYEKRFNGVSSMASANSPLFATDKNGNYTIENVHEGLLGVGLAISWHLIHDKQKENEFYLYADATTESVFNFEFYDAVRFKSISLKNDVLYYEIEDPLHSPERAYVISARHTDPSYDTNASARYDSKSNLLKGSVAIDALRLGSLFSFDFSTSKDELKIERFIEPLYLSDNYAFTVSPYYTNGTDRYVSNGFFTDALSEFMFIKGQEALSEGDMLLSKGKMDEALAWYDKDRSLHSLKVLSSLYRKGYTVEEDLEFSQELGNVDTDKSLYYTQMLISKYGENDNLLSTLARTYQESQNFQEESKIYEKLIQKAPENSYLHESYAISIINQGRFSEGIEYLLDHASESKRLYMRNNFFIIANLTDAMDDSIYDLLKSIDGIEHYSRFHELINSGDYLKASSWLDGQPGSELKVMYQLLFEDTFRHLITESTYDSFYYKYTETVETIETESISKLLKAVKRYHNWF